MLDTKIRLLSVWNEYYPDPYLRFARACCADDGYEGFYGDARRHAQGSDEPEHRIRDRSCFSS